jgi:hypothetical protein
MAPNAPAPLRCSMLRYVLVVEGPNGLDAELFAHVLSELGAELQERGLGVCRTPNDDRPAAAVVALSRVDAKHLLIDIDDRATDKRISRSVSLASLPADGHALAVAVAIDELLRASWAELLLHTRPSVTEGTKRTPPRPAHAQPAAKPREASDAPASTPRSPNDVRANSGWSVWAAGLYERARPDWRGFGGALRARYAATQPLHVGAGLRAEHARRNTNEGGSIAATAVGLELGPGACVERGLRLCADLRLVLDVVAFDGRAHRGSDASARDRRGVPIQLALALGAEWPRRGALFGRLELGVGYAVHGVAARSEGEALLGLTGAVLGASLGLGVRP